MTNKTGNRGKSKHIYIYIYIDMNVSTEKLPATPVRPWQWIRWGDNLRRWESSSTLRAAATVAIVAIALLKERERERERDIASIYE